MNKRFRVAQGKMLVVKPDNSSSVHSVLLIHDRENNAVGVQLTDTELRGYTFFINKQSFLDTESKGVEVDAVKRVR
jgi:hypothetical protein